MGKNINDIEQLSYKYLKRKYLKIPYSYDKSDKYRPGLVFTMAIIPGLGHIYTDELLRDLIFCGTMGISFLSFAEAVSLASESDPFLTSLSYPLGLGGIAGFIFFYTKNIIDAAQVARVKNFAIRNNDISLNFLPDIHFNNVYSQPSNSFGFKLVMDFSLQKYSGKQIQPELVMQE